MTHNYKILLVGDSGTGKTTFVHRHRMGSFITQHNPTVGADIKSITFYTNYGSVKFDIWDCGGKQQYKQYVDGFYSDKQAALVFFDVNNISSYNNASQWANSIHNILPTAPIVICGNKCDRRDRKVPIANIDIHRTLSTEWDRTVHYYDISSKSNYNFDKPFLFMARQLTNKEDLQFVPSPGIVPPAVSIQPLCRLQSLSSKL